MKNKQPSDFNGKTVLITGASSGLGEQFSRCLSNRGARVLLASRRIDKLNELSKKMGNAKAIQMDVADKKSVISCFDDLEKAGEQIDTCINNAGIAKLTPIFEDDPHDDFESLIQTNLMGVWYVTKAAASHMKNNNIHGSMINIGNLSSNAASRYVTGSCFTIDGGISWGGKSW